MSPYLRKIPEGIVHWCPGCEQAHAIWINEAHPSTGAKWTWDGDVTKPTLSPSVHLPGECHYHLIAGQLQYLTDSRHALAGKTVPLPVFPVEVWPEDE